MIWLATQMWIELVLFAALGGSAGWWLCKTMAARDAAQKPQAASTVVVAPAAPITVPAPLEAAPAKPDHEADIGRRRLEARVRYLEAQLAVGENSRVDPKPKVNAEPPLLDAAQRLKWRATYLEGRVKYLEEELSRGGSLVATIPSAPAPLETDAPASPLAALPGPRDGKADDLQMIAGVGPKLEQLLNRLGIFHFDQIAEWTQREIDWANQTMSFRGRIEREKWVAQATELARNTKRAREQQSGEQPAGEA